MKFAICFLLSQFARFAAAALPSFDFGVSGSAPVVFTTGATAYQWSTFAGKAASSGSADGFGSAARFNNPIGIAVDSSGNVYVGDWGNCTVRKISPAGSVVTFAGQPGQTGSSDGFGPAARFGARVPTSTPPYVRSLGPKGLAVDGSGNVFVADQNNALRKITPAGYVSTFAGVAGTVGSPFHGLSGVAVRGSGPIYAADENGNFIGKLTPQGVFSSFAGLVGYPGLVDGTGSDARFSVPFSATVDAAGAVYVADSNNNVIRKITPGGTVSIYAGVGFSGSTDGMMTGDFTTDPLFHTPYGVAVDDAGNVYVADGFNNTIRKISPGQVVSTIGGVALQKGSADGVTREARFNSPHGVAVDSQGNIYVADFFNHTIRKGVPLQRYPATYAAGSYSALVGNFGSIAIRLTKRGTFTGKLSLNGTSYTVSGVLDGNGNFSGMTATSSAPQVAITIQLTGGETIRSFSFSGTAGGSEFTATHEAYETGETVAEVGRRTILLRATDGAAGIPQGTGYGVLTIGKTGSAKLVGKLSDNTAFSTSGTLVSAATGVRFIISQTSLYRNKGRILGVLTFQTQAGSDCDGLLRWIKPQQTRADNYPEGFDTYLAVTGTLYGKPRVNETALPFSMGALSLGTSINEPVTISPINIITVSGANPHGIKLKLAAASGGLTGTFLSPANGKLVKFAAVLFQNATNPQAAGFFLESGLSQPVDLTP